MVVVPGPGSFKNGPKMNEARISKQGSKNKLFSLICGMSLCFVPGLLLLIHPQSFRKQGAHCEGKDKQSQT